MGGDGENFQDHRGGGFPSSTMTPPLHFQLISEARPNVASSQAPGRWVVSQAVSQSVRKSFVSQLGSQ